MAHRGVRPSKNSDKGGHAAAGDYLREELLLHPELKHQSAEAIYKAYDTSRRIRNKVSYGPRMVDEKSARTMVQTGKKVLKQVCSIISLDRDD